MLGVLITQKELDDWLTAPLPEASMLQRLPEGMLKIVARDEKRDRPEAVAQTLLL